MDTKETKKNTRELYKALRYSLLSKNVKEETRPIVKAKNCLFYGKDKYLENVDTYALLKKEINKHDYPLHELVNIKAFVKGKNSTIWAGPIFITLTTYILDSVYNAQVLLNNIYNKIFHSIGEINNWEFLLGIVILILLILLLLVLMSAIVGCARNTYLLTIIESVEACYKSPIAKGEEEKQHCNNKEIASQCKVNEPSLEPNDITYMITIHKT